MSPVSPLPKKNPPPPQGDAEPAAQPPAGPPRPGGGFGFLIFLIMAALVLGGLVYFFGILPRLTAKTALDREQKINGQHIVIYALARLAAPKVELPLPGTVEAFQQASIFARTNGYVKRWLVDIGDLVHEGDLLAELDTPEVDQELSQAKATAQQAKAAVDIAQTAADRWDAMVKAHAVSQEEADEKNATLSEAKAVLSADEANVGQLSALENFKRILAPFTGTITYRNIEVGNLVSSGTGTSTGANTGSGSARTTTTELYRVAQTDPLRLYVDVPEANTRSIQPGVEADVHVAAYPDRVFHGEVVRNAGALDTASRTLRTEIRVPNPDGALLPGAFAEVRLNLVDGAPSILIPANTLIVNSAGTQVALIENIDGKDKVHFLPVKVGRDFGTEVEIVQDVREGDRLVTNPAADLSEGAVVTAKPLPKPANPTPPNPAPKP
jgi:multidrug efflux pump subunit AcrA (membrane-fusion protein)